MENNNTSPKVDKIINNLQQWKEGFDVLRKIILDCELKEELKWGCPCYIYQNSNIVLIHGFKEYFAILFFKGVLLNDADKILVHQTENVQAARQVRFTNVQELLERTAILKSYIYEAIEVERAGLKVEYKASKELVYAEELQNKFNENPAFKSAFEALTPGRQRAYNLYFSNPKQSKTREARVEKYIQNILNGKGLND